MSDSEIEQGLSGREGDAIVRDLEFDDFAGAIAFVNPVAEVAEDANHHPYILVHSWNNVRLRVSTHSEGASRTTVCSLPAG